MKVAECERVFELDQVYWWFVATRDAIADALVHAGWLGPDVRVLDVGCGSGAMLDRLSQTSPCTGVDLVPDCVRHTLAKGHARVANADAGRLPFPDGSFDLLLATDVIEHCPDDAAVLAEFRRVLAPGGRLLVSVPAFSFLWSHHDEAVDHYRRYRRGPLRERLRAAGFRVSRDTYFTSYLFPLLAVLRPLQRLLPRQGPVEADYVPVPDGLNRLLIAVGAAEAWLLRRVSLPFGVSLLALAERDDGRSGA